MKLKTLLIIKAIVCLGFGPLLLFVPAWLLDILGTSFGPGAAFTARLYGAALFGNLLLTWLARKTEDATARRAISWHLFLYDAIGLVVTLALLFSGSLGVLSWGIVAVYLFFTLGFGYQLLKQK
jgi:hypothetical protein